VFLFGRIPYQFEVNNRALSFWVTFWLQKVTEEKIREQRLNCGKASPFLGGLGISGLRFFVVS
jgi:hypothetical protein